MSVHGHSSEEGAEKVIELLILIIPLLRVLLPLRTGSLLLGSEAIIVRSLLSIDENRIRVRYFLEDLLGAYVESGLPSC